MVERLNILVVVISLLFIQDLKKTQTAKQMTVESDTISGVVITKDVYNFHPDTIYFQEMNKKLKTLDSITQLKKKK